MKTNEQLNKKRTAVWMYPETIESIDRVFASDNCKSRSEFIEKAVTFYVGYLTSRQSSEYLSQILVGAVKAVIRDSENRQASNLFRLSVEMSMMMHILAYGYEIDEDAVRKLRGACIQELKRTKGRVAVEDAFEHPLLEQLENSEK